MSSNPEKLPFETAYDELTRLIDQLESGDLSLDEAMTLFERGKRLIGMCEQMLDAADLRVSQLSGDAEQGFKREPLK